MIEQWPEDLDYPEPTILQRLRRWWASRRYRRTLSRIEGAPMMNARRAMAGLKRDTAWLAQRPFSDKYDGDDARGGYFAAASGSSGRSLEDDQPFHLKPVPPHPRARKVT